MTTHDDWEDQLADRALQELHGDAPPDLTMRVLAALHAAPPMVAGVPTHAVARPRRARFVGTLVAAAAALALLATLWWPDAPEREVAVAQVELVVLDGAAVVTEVATAAHEPRTFELTRGGETSWSVRPGDQLESGGDRGMALLMRPFGVLTTEMHTRLEVRSMEMTMKHGVLATGALTLSVVAGVATWHSMSHLGHAEAGHVLRMEAQADGGQAMAALVAENQRLQDELAAAQLREQALANQVAREPVAVPPPAQAATAAETPMPATAAPEAAANPVVFDDAQFAAALAAVDWKLVGSVSAEMAPMLAELLKALNVEGAELPMDQVMAIQKLNMKLVEQLPGLLKAGLPGFGPNGTYLHPLVASNSLASMLQHAGQPLTDAQRASMAGLVRVYAAEAQALHGQSHDFELEGLAADVAMKDRFFDEVGGLLGPEQAALMSPPGSTTHDGGNLFNTGLMFQLYNEPVPAANATEFARVTSQKLEQQLGLDAERAEQVRALLERSAGAAPELWRDRGTPSESSARLLKSGRGKAALQRQLQWMREIERTVGLSPEQQKKLRGLKRVFVPLPR